jgi:hypothetical protein
MPGSLSRDDRPSVRKIPGWQISVPADYPADMPIGGTGVFRAGRFTQEQVACGHDLSAALCHEPGLRPAEPRPCPCRTDGLGPVGSPSIGQGRERHRCDHKYNCTSEPVHTTSDSAEALEVGPPTPYPPQPTTNAPQKTKGPRGLPISRPSVPGNLDCVGPVASHLGFRFPHRARTLAKEPTWPVPSWAAMTGGYYTCHAT